MDALIKINGHTSTCTPKKIPFLPSKKVRFLLSPGLALRFGLVTCDFGELRHISSSCVPKCGVFRHPKVGRSEGAKRTPPSTNRWECLPRSLIHPSDPNKTNGLGRNHPKSMIWGEIPPQLGGLGRNSSK